MSPSYKCTLCGGTAQIVYDRINSDVSRWVYYADCHGTRYTAVLFDDGGLRAGPKGALLIRARLANHPSYVASMPPEPKVKLKRKAKW